MIKAVCVNSANDAAVAVAEFVGGSEPAFVERMNARAAELGMTHTSFKNACGLDEEGHYSSARDVAVMSLALMQHPQVFEYTKIWTDTLRGGQTQLTNTNKLLRRYEGITGLKTGTTGKAGVCISATATRSGTGFIAVILGSPSSKDRFDAATTLLDYGFANFERADFPQVEGLPSALPVSGGCARSVELVCTLPRDLLVKKGEAAALHCKVTVESSLQAPVAAGQTVGQLELYSGGVLLQKYPVATEQAVEKMSFPLALELLRKALFAL
jgi:D-alanyl-D-alanine carboxypeptidase (penicillin-binding protein 5/6)